MTGKRLQLTRKPKKIASRCNKTGASREAIPGQEQSAASPVVDGECEHPIEASGELFAPLFVAVNQNLVSE